MKSNPDPTHTITKEEHARLLSDHIIAEIAYAFGMQRNGWAQKFTSPLIQIPARVFGRIAADFYDDVINLGVSPAAIKALPRFDHEITARGMDRIPQNGPLLLISNHPGGLDSLGIVSCIPRNDLRILVTDVEFMHLLDIRKRFFFYVSFETTGGMVALRDAIEHLRSGGALLLYAHGDVDPEPEYFSTAIDEIANWSPSIEIMLRKVPETHLQISTISGAVQRRYLESPITRLRKEKARQQKLAEFIQVIQCMLLRPRTRIQLHLSIGSPMETAMLGSGRWMPAVILAAQEQLADHLNWVHSLSPYHQK